MRGRKPHDSFSDKLLELIRKGRTTVRPYEQRADFRISSNITASVARQDDVDTIGFDTGRQGVCDSPLHQSGAFMPAEAVILSPQRGLGEKARSSRQVSRNHSLCAVQYPYPDCQSRFLPQPPLGAFCLMFGMTHVCVFLVIVEVAQPGHHRPLTLSGWIIYIKRFFDTPPKS